MIELAVEPDIILDTIGMAPADLCRKRGPGTRVEEAADVAAVVAPYVQGDPRHRTQYRDRGHRQRRSIVVGPSLHGFGQSGYHKWRHAESYR